MKPFRICYTGGATMGSVSPLLGVHKELQKQDIAFESFWIGTADGPEKEVVTQAHISFESVICGKYRRYFSLKNLIDPLFIYLGFIQALFKLARKRPDMVMTSGGYVSVPVAYAAWLLKIPVWVHQQDLELGLSNKLMRPIASRVTVALPELRKQFRYKKAAVTGNPIREDFLREYNTKECRTHFGFNNDLPCALIMGGGTGATSINELVNESVRDLAKHMNVIHVTGRGKKEHMISLENYCVKEFLSAQEMAYAYTASDLVVSRAGMSSLLELSALGKASIIIPIPDSHQEANAQYFSRKGGVLELDQRNLTGELFTTHIEKLLFDTQKRAELSGMMKTIHHKQGAKNMADLVFSEILSKSLFSVKQVYISGIGGIGTSAVAKYYHEQNVIVHGSDVQESELTTELEGMGIDVSYRQDGNHVLESTDVMIYSPAVPDDNPERVKAKELGIWQVSYPEFLSIFSRLKKTVSISGTHGKSTTTALAGLVLSDGGIDPTVFVGSRVDTFPLKNVRVGDSDVLVAESCEYKEAMTHFSPSVIVLTNIEFDHPDYYTSLEHVKEAFKKYVAQLPADGLLIYNADDENVRDIASTYHGGKLSFGADKADISYGPIVVSDGEQRFEVMQNGKTLGVITLQVPGLYNVYNALAAIACGLSQGVTFESISQTLSSFNGIWRRFERVGEKNEAIVISDYGHHPTAVSGTLQGARAFFPGRRIVLLYQPHQHARTKQLFSEFTESFDEADLILMADIYDVAGREEQDLDISSEKLVEILKQKQKQAYASGGVQESRDMLRKHMQSGDLVIVMGAGDIYTVSQEILES